MVLRPFYGAKLVESDFRERNLKIASVDRSTAVLKNQLVGIGCHKLQIGLGDSVSYHVEISIDNGAAFRTGGQNSRDGYGFYKGGEFGVYFHEARSLDSGGLVTRKLDQLHR